MKNKLAGTVLQYLVISLLTPVVLMVGIPALKSVIYASGTENYNYLRPNTANFIILFLLDFIFTAVLLLLGIYIFRHLSSHQTRPAVFAGILVSVALFAVLLHWPFILSAAENPVLFSVSFSSYALLFAFSFLKRGKQE
ncbi:MAG TPA: hypothetical protein VHP31_04235 [Caproicibacter sp.]|nr:hypothetical protein [Caproicibacter sp.]